VPTANETVAARPSRICIGRKTSSSLSHITFDRPRTIRLKIDGSFASLRLASLPIYQFTFDWHWLVVQLMDGRLLVCPAPHNEHAETVTEKEKRKSEKGKKGKRGLTQKNIRLLSQLECIAKEMRARKTRG